MGPNSFSKNHLIIDYYNFTQYIGNYPDYVNVDGISSYGNILKLNEYDKFIPCAVYRKGEVAAVIQRKRARELPIQTQGYYLDYTYEVNLKTSLGIYVSCVALTLFFISFFISWLADIILFPRLEKIIKNNRIVILENESDMNLIENTEQQIKQTKNGNQTNDKEFLDDNISDIDMKKLQKTIPLAEKSFSKGNLDDHSGEISSPIILINDTSNDKINTEHPLKSQPNQTLNENITTAGQEKLTINQNQKDLKTDQILVKNQVNEKYESAQSNNIIFSDEYIKKKEINEFSFCQQLLHGNEILNLITVTNNIYERTARCILIYNNIQLTFLCSACLFAYIEKPLDHQVYSREAKIPETKYLWISFVSPILAAILQYIFAGFFKMNGDKLLKARFYQKYLRLLYI